MFYYEVTQACDLVCVHCRASAQPESAPDELTSDQSRALIDQVATFARPPVLVLTGGDPLKRPDLFDLIRHGAAAGLQIALTPSATPLATRDAFEKAKEAGVQMLGIRLDGADAEMHDSFRGWEGSFDRTLTMLANAHDVGLPVQLNTSITRRNFHQIDAMAELLATQQIAMWSVFFLIPVGRGVEEERITPAEYEIAFDKLWQTAGRGLFSVKTTEAPHYRRYVLQQNGDPLAAPSKVKDPSGRGHHRAPLGVWDGRGVMFISHSGEVYPAGFLPVVCGRFPDDSVVDVYKNHPTFRALRDFDQFKGKCGLCEYRHICGGSRARAFAVTGDFLESEPDCVYEPEQPFGAVL